MRSPEDIYTFKSALIIASIQLPGSRFFRTDGALTGAWMGSTYFLTKGLKRVKTEMSLHVFAYNLKRLMARLGIAGIMDAIRAYVLFLR